MAGDKPKRGDVTRSLDQRHDIFNKLHHVDKLSMREIAFRLGVSLGALSRWKRARQIITRTQREGVQIKSDLLLPTVEKVIEMRLRDHLSLKEIASQCGYKSKTRVHKILKSVGLEGNLSDLPTWEEWLEAVRKGKSRGGAKADEG